MCGWLEALTLLARKPERTVLLVMGDVPLAAPFAPFSADIRKETDILDITRTWQFMNNNQLFAR